MQYATCDSCCCVKGWSNLRCLISCVCVWGPGAAFSLESSHWVMKSCSWQMGTYLSSSVFLLCCFCVSLYIWTLSIKCANVVFLYFYKCQGNSGAMLHHVLLNLIHWIASCLVIKQEMKPSFLNNKISIFYLTLITLNYFSIPPYYFGSVTIKCWKYKYIVLLMVQEGCSSSRWV